MVLGDSVIRMTKKLSDKDKEQIDSGIKDIQSIVEQIEKLSEMLCSVENKKTIKESHVLSLLRYMDLINELKQVNS